MVSPIIRLVMNDILARDKAMQLKHNDTMKKDSYGDNTLQEAYQEAIDLCVYIRAELERRK